MKQFVLRAIAVPFFVAAVGVYIYVHFLAIEPVYCDAFSFFSTFAVGCLVTSITWGVVCLLALPGIFLWTAGSGSKTADETDT